MPVLKVALLNGLSINSLLSTARKKFPGRGAAVDWDSFVGAEEEPQDYYLCPIEDAGVCCWHLQGRQQGMFPLQRNQKQVKDLCLSHPSPPFLP